MSATKDEERTLKFLQMAKKFNWNLSGLSKRSPNQHNIRNSIPLNRNNICSSNPITAINNHNNPSPIPFNFQTTNKQNPISNTPNINNSIIDSEATFSEDDTYEFNPNKQHSTLNTNTNTNQSNLHIPFKFSTPIKNYDEIQRQKHHSFIKQHMKSASKSILGSPIPRNKNTQNINKINPIPNIISNQIPVNNTSHPIHNNNTNILINTNEHINKNISINRNNISFSTHNSNEKHSTNSKCSSLELTEENISKHNQSFNIQNKSNSESTIDLESVSSVLSKHHTFVLLEVSSENESNVSENKQIKNNIGKTNAEVDDS